MKPIPHLTRNRAVVETEAHIPPSEGRTVPLTKQAHRWASGDVTANTCIRILIAGEYPFVRAGLRMLLDAEPDFDVIGEAAHGAEAITLTRDLQPDVLLFVRSMRETSGLDVLRQIGDCTAVRTILMTPAIDTQDTVNVLRCGARGIVLKDSPTYLLFKSIRCVFGGELWLGREVMSDVVQALSASNGRRPEAPAHYRLTSRERQVLTLVVSGYANREIAQTLSISEDTVKHHMTSIFDKTGVSNRLELALFAIHHRIVANPSSAVSSDEQ